MKDKVKLALRIQNSKFDDEINGLIDAALADLRLVGVNIKKEVLATEENEISVANPLLARAIILYAKANFGLFEDTDRYKKAYDELKCALSLAGEYIVE